MSKLRDMRKARGMTQEELAKAIGTHKTYISRLEAGDRDINNIRTDTMKRLCVALNCQPEDLIENDDFEFEEENGRKRLIVDELYFANGNFLWVKIKSRIYRLYPFSVDLLKGDVSKYLIKRGDEKIPQSASPLDKKGYCVYSMIPRDGIEVDVGDPISEDDWEELKLRLKLTENDISDEFEAVRGALYGKKYAKTMTCRQIALRNNENPISIESELREKGIEAAAINFDRVNIRVK